jgi:ParB-like chromosome segregation protein Spo0J
MSELKFLREAELTREQKEDLRDSIGAKGVLVPILVSEDGYIIDGVKRWVIAKELGIADIPKRVIPVRCTENMDLCKALRVVSNTVRWPSVTMEERRNVVLVYTKLFLEKQPEDVLLKVRESLRRGEVPNVLRDWIVQQTGLPKSTIYDDLSVLLTIPDVRRLLLGEEEKVPAVVLAIPAAAREELQELPEPAREEVIKAVKEGKVPPKQVRKVIETVKKQLAQPEVKPEEVREVASEGVVKGELQRIHEEATRKLIKSSDDLYEDIRNGKVKKDDVVVLFKPAQMSKASYLSFMTNMQQLALNIGFSDEFLEAVGSAVVKLPPYPTKLDVIPWLFTFVCEASRNLVSIDEELRAKYGELIDKVCVRREIPEIEHLLLLV